MYGKTHQKTNEEQRKNSDKGLIFQIYQEIYFINAETKMKNLIGKWANAINRLLTHKTKYKALRHIKRSSSSLLNKINF